MNKERVGKCIEMMRGAKSLKMMDWQFGPAMGYCDNTEELHACGNTACFAGYLAISDFFRADGGGRDHVGRPFLSEGSYDYSGSDAVAKYLGISTDLADLIVFGEHGGGNSYSSFYGKNFGDVTPDDVIEKLQLILKGELE